MEKQRSGGDNEPSLPKPLPATYSEASAVLNEAIDRNAIGPASSPYRERFTDTIKKVQGMVVEAELTEEAYHNAKNKLQNEVIRKLNSRRRIHKGGPINVTVARAKMVKRNTAEAKEAIRVAQSRLQRAVNKVKKIHKDQGIKARKEMKTNKALYWHLRNTGQSGAFSYTSRA